MKNYTSLSVPKLGKLHCGDAAFSANITISGNDFFLILVADGISNSISDRLTSSYTVQLITESLKHSSLTDKEAFVEAIKYANEALYYGIDGTTGLLTTLSAALYDPLKGKLYLFNIGDSRIYGFQNNNWVLLSSDDSVFEPIFQNSKLRSQNGMPQVKPVLTEAMGLLINPDIIIREIMPENFQAILIASDGYYSLPEFYEYNNTLNNSPDIDPFARSVQSDFTPYLTDDTSFAILRLADNKHFDLRSYLNSNDNSTVILAEVWSVMEDEIRQCILNDENEYLSEIITFMTTK